MPLLFAERVCDTGLDQFSSMVVEAQLEFGQIEFTATSAVSKIDLGLDYVTTRESTRSAPPIFLPTINRRLTFFFL